MYLRISGVITVALLAFAALADAPAKLTRDNAAKLKDPIAYTKKSINAGRATFLQNCTSCHGEDGKAEGSLIASATDLTTPALYKSGSTEGEIFRSIRDGAGDQMPAFKSQLSSETDIWNLVNFIRSLWPESQRPALQDDAK
ncbi:MAG TPA: cytochrome c [Bryobacteraceae bacterium]|nr:cytochrome c [Bryobacteraceae bacterium]